MFIFWTKSENKCKSPEADYDGCISTSLAEVRWTRGGAVALSSEK